ncbi:alpha/beta fold hydrolase [Arthrobacter sp. GMC3]|uniref:alpha/beta fold hydrolase n=1 Tax=Arthrobacter sp. GMC3 TaxID=2058894 RepID=UPI000CE4E1B1|nr:alpha/beta hydrolase [Arthrobacter sp. GMC3]
MTRGFIERDGTGLHFVECGSGPTVLLLHGLAGESGEFAATMTALSADYRVVAMDQRGHGRSTRRPMDLSRDVFVQDVVSLMQNVSPGAPVHLVGQSMGAHTAMLTAARRPDLVASLVLLESDAGSGSERDAIKIGEYFASWPVPFPTRESAQRFLGDSPIAKAWTGALEQRHEGLCPRFDGDIMVACIRHVMEPRWEEWASVQVPALVIYAENGMFSDGQKELFVGHRPGTQRIDIPNSGHDAHLEQSEAWIGALSEFLGVSQTAAQQYLLGES